MELAKISIDACGYYSDSSHHESIFIKKESYEKMQDEIDNIEIYISDLDGKHSECEAELNIEFYNEDKLLKSYRCEYDDGDNLYYRLYDIFESHGMNLENEYRVLKKYLNHLDTYVDRKITIRKSQLPKLEEFLKTIE